MSLNRPWTYGLNVLPTLSPATLAKVFQPFLSLIRPETNRLALQLLVLGGTGDRLNNSHGAPWEIYKRDSNSLRAWTC